MGNGAMPGRSMSASDRDCSELNRPIGPLPNRKPGVCATRWIGTSGLLSAALHLIAIGDCHIPPFLAIIFTPNPMSVASQSSSRTRLLAGLDLGQLIAMGANGAASWQPPSVANIAAWLPAYEVQSLIARGG